MSDDYTSIYDSPSPVGRAPRDTEALELGEMGAGSLVQYMSWVVYGLYIDHSYI